MLPKIATASFIVLFAVVLAACTPRTENANTPAQDAPTQGMNEQNQMNEDAATGDNIVQLAQSTPQLSTLVDAVVAADLVETLSGPGPFTVFAPTNDAFAKVPQANLNQLLAPAGREQLTAVLTYHVVPGNVMAADLSNGQTLTTVNGQTLTVSIQGDSVRVGNATVTTPDIQASNGVVHLIDTVLMPTAQ